MSEPVGDEAEAKALAPWLEKEKKQIESEVPRGEEEEVDFVRTFMLLVENTQELPGTRVVWFSYLERCPANRGHEGLHRAASPICPSCQPAQSHKRACPQD